MDIFFLMRNSGYLRNYESVLRLLAARGHSVHLGFFKISDVFQERAIIEFVQDIPGISYTVYVKRTWLWKGLARYVRQLQTYLRFLDIRYRDAKKLRARAASLLPRPICWLVRMIVGDSTTRIWSLIKCLRLIEKAIPLDPFIVEVFKSHHPDVFLVTPLIDLRASQLDWLKCAKASGIRSCMCVASWDNLSNKSLIQIEPDAIFVWNRIQQQEAVELHRISSSKITVTGAQCYDHLFAHQPSTSGDNFRMKVGLQSQIPFILYLCSSPFIAPLEVHFVRKWIAQLRNSADSQIKNIGVLVRPHPQNASQWRNIDLTQYKNVAVYPRQGANPIGGHSLDDFFDSMYYSVATVGINTSTMIESGILNKPVLTILSSQFKDTQKGTIHFHYLVDGGLLNISHNLDEHFNQLGRILTNRESYQARIRGFIQGFVRPHGLDRECSPIFVEAIEKLVQGNCASPVSSLQ